MCFDHDVLIWHAYLAKGIIKLQHFVPKRDPNFDRLPFIGHHATKKPLGHNFWLKMLSLLYCALFLTQHLHMARVSLEYITEDELRQHHHHHPGPIIHTVQRRFPFLSESFKLRNLPFAKMPLSH
jgi:hypothetical protein